MFHLQNETDFYEMYFGELGCDES